MGTIRVIGKVVLDGLAMNEGICMTQNNQNAVDAPSNGKMITKLHKDLDARMPRHLRETLFKEAGFEAGMKIRWTGKIGKSGSVLLSLTKVE